MAELNVSIPEFECFVRTEFIYPEALKGGLEKCLVFGVTSIEGRALGFNVMTEKGAVIGRLPIHALCKKGSDKLSLDVCQLWDCFSYNVTVTEYDYLSGMNCTVSLKDNVKALGKYRFTIDWYGNAASERAGHTGWKCAHFIELDSGNYVLQPNNRIRWHDSSFTNVNEERPGYKIITEEYKCESMSRFVTDAMYFYEIESRFTKGFAYNDETELPGEIR